MVAVTDAESKKRKEVSRTSAKECIFFEVGRRLCKQALYEMFKEKSTADNASWIRKYQKLCSGKNVVGIWNIVDNMVVFSDLP